MGKFAFLLFIVLAVCLVACGGEPETVEETAPPDIAATMEPATDTPTPETITEMDVKEPVTCDGVEGPCVEVTFDGENCLVTEPTDNQTGWYVFAFNNAFDGVAKIEAGMLAEGRTLEDLAKDTAKRPSGYAPPWISPIGMWDQPVGAGESVKYRRQLTSGTYGVLCFRVPQYAVYGDGFTVAEAAIPPTDTPFPPTDTPMPATDTPVPPLPPPTPTHGPTPCDDVDGTCMFLRFDGETCAYVGPVEIQSGPATIVYYNDGPSSSLGSLVLLTDGKTMEDVITYQGWGPFSGIGPSWQDPVAGWNTRGGESYTWEGAIEEGEYYLACIRIVPDGVWVGGGLSVTD